VKIIDAINRLDNLKHNTYTQNDKLEWLSRLDSMVKTHIIDTHEGAENVSFTGYTDATPLDTVLLVPAPHDEIYLRWMEAQIDYHNGEYDHYNNAIILFNTAFEAYQQHYNSAHKPVQRGRRFLF
jgi:hypothetical protein